MSKPVQVFVEQRAQIVLNHMDEAHHAQVLRLVAALRLSPRAGVYYARDGRNRTLWQISGADVHLIYTLLYHVAAEQVFVVAIEITEWTPAHTEMP